MKEFKICYEFATDLKDWLIEDTNDEYEIDDFYDFKKIIPKVDIFTLGVIFFFYNQIRIKDMLML